MRNSILCIAGVFAIGSVLGSSVYALGQNSMMNTSANGVSFMSKDLFPEGISYDSKTDTVFVSSMKYGTIGTVSTDGIYTPMFDDDDFISTAGLEVDVKRRRLYIAVTDPGVSVKTSKKTQMQTAAVAVYNIDTKKRIAFFRLHELYEGAHFANDIAVAQDGTVYITDSFSPVVYSISADLKKAAVFTKNDAFVPGDGFHLNGIVALGGGAEKTLVVNKYNTGELFTIDIATKTVRKITLPETINIVGADGLIEYKGFLITSHNAGNDGITIIKLNKNMDSAEAVTLTADAFSSNSPQQARLDNQTFTVTLPDGVPLFFPTTITRGPKGSLFILNAGLGDAFAGKSRTDYSIAYMTKQ